MSLVNLDKIHLQGIRLEANIGCLDWEKQCTQPLSIDLTLFLDLNKAAQSDRLADTVNYAAVAESVRAMATSKHFELLEHLASRVIEQLWLLFPMVQSIEITVNKGAILPSVQSVSVCLFREKMPSH